MLLTYRLGGSGRMLATRSGLCRLVPSTREGSPMPMDNPKPLPIWIDLQAVLTEELACIKEGRVDPELQGKTEESRLDELGPTQLPAANSSRVCSKPISGVSASRAAASVAPHCARTHPKSSSGQAAAPVSLSLHRLGWRLHRKLALKLGTPASRGHRRGSRGSQPTAGGQEDRS